MAKSTGKRRPKGSIERRGNSFRVKVYAGVDPLTGKRTYLSDSTTDEGEAEKILARLRAQVDNQRNARTQGTLRTAIEEWLPNHDVEESTGSPTSCTSIASSTPHSAMSRSSRSRPRCSKTSTPNYVDAAPLQRQAVHRAPRGRRTRVPRSEAQAAAREAAGYPKHDCDKVGCKVIECQPHTCKLLAPSTISKIHFVLSAVFAACLRWEWIDSNPADVARKPRQPSPEPEPPTAEQAGRVVEAAWSESEDWGTLVWLVMVTGLRRAELLALRWRHVDLDAISPCGRTTCVWTARPSRRTPRPIECGESRSIPPRSKCCVSTELATKRRWHSSASNRATRRTCSRTRPTTPGRTIPTV